MVAISVDGLGWRRSRSWAPPGLPRCTGCSPKAQARSTPARRTSRPDVAQPHRDAHRTQGEGEARTPRRPSTTTRAAPSTARPDAMSRSLFDVVHDHGGARPCSATRTSSPTSTGPGVRVRSTGPGRPRRRARQDRPVRLPGTPQGSGPQGPAPGGAARAPGRATFLHLARPDVVGHKQRLSVRRSTSTRCGPVTARWAGSSTRSPATRDSRPSTVVVLTADHGGQGSGTTATHRRRTTTRIPFIVWGAGVSAGRGPLRPQPRRTDPGAGRPAYRDRLRSATPTSPAWSPRCSACRGSRAGSCAAPRPSRSPELAARRLAGWTT